MRKSTADKEGAGPPLPRVQIERIPEAEPRRFYVLSADIEAHGHTEVVGLCRAGFAWKSDKPHNECRARIRKIRTLTGKARMNVHKTESPRHSE